MRKCVEETNPGEDVKGKRVRTTSDDVDGKSLSEKSKSTGVKCMKSRSHFRKKCVEVGYVF